MPNKKKKKVAGSKGKPKPKAGDRQVVVLRLPPSVVESLDAMAAEVQMSRNAMATLILVGATSMHQQHAADPGLFGQVEGIIDASLKRAFGKGLK